MSATTQYSGDAIQRTFTHNGKTYSLRLVDMGLQADWEKYQLQRAREFEAGNKPFLTHDEFSERLDKLSDNYHSGHYSLLSWFVKNSAVFAEFKKVQEGPKTSETPTKTLLLTKEVAEGFLLLSSLIFQCDPTEMQKLMLERGAEVATLVGLIVRESMPTNITSSTPTGEISPNA